MNERVIGRVLFLKMVYLSEAGLMLFALLPMMMVGGEQFIYRVDTSIEAVLMGVVLSLPPVLLLIAGYSPIIRHVPPIHRAMENILDKMRPPLESAIRSLQIYDIVLISLAAGIAEEIFFRGLMQGLIGIVAASVIFGFLHALTMTYFLIATVIGVYLGIIYELSGNLLPSIIIHTLYDIVAIYMLRYQFTSNSSECDQKAI